MHFFLPAVTISLTLFISGCNYNTKQQVKPTYPEAALSSQTDIYHGTTVADPYRWLESLDTEETKTWIKAENQLTSSFLNNIAGKETIKARLKELWDFERYSVPYKKGDKYFFQKNDGLQNQSVVYSMSNLHEEPKLLLDPNLLSDDGTVALAHTEVSPDGKYFAYATAAGGSDWNQWYVRDITTGKDLTDELLWVKFSGVSWSSDSQGFYYSRYDEPVGEDQLKAVNYNQKLYYHKVGEAQNKDQLIYQRADHKEWGFDGTVSDDGRYLIITVSQGTLDQQLIYTKDLTRPEQPIQPLIDKWHASFEFLGNDGSLLWFLTDHQAAHYRVIGIDLKQPTQWQELIAETKDTIRQVAVLNHSFVVTYLHDAWHKVVIYDAQGNKANLSLPGIGSVRGFYGEAADTETFYGYTSFNTPRQIFRLDLKTGKSTPYKTPELKFSPDDYVTKQVFYKSKDGTRVPMFIAHKKGLKPNANTPTLLYGYGGFNISLSPWFKVSNLVWMEMGGIYAMPNLRGGGEYGKAWHEAGTKLEKQNVFDDFIAAAEWLISNNYTSAKKLAIHGGSNGGLLVGATELQRPDLFAAALPAVGVMDMLRFNQFTIGWAWESDYGSPKNPDEFKALYAYSPLHNIKTGTHYPATLITTADHDDRVFPAHSFKYAAALQAAQGGNAPILIRIETRAGHGAGKPTSKRIEAAADKLAFLKQVLSID